MEKGCKATQIHEKNSKTVDPTYSHEGSRAWASQMNKIKELRKTPMRIEKILPLKHIEKGINYPNP